MVARLLSVVLLACSLVAPATSRAQAEPPDALVKRVSSDVLDSVRADKSIQSGDIRKVVALVDAKVLPSFDFARMTASAVGPAWTKATPDQQKQLQDEFKILLVRVYSGALAQATDRTLEVKPLQGAGAREVIVRTEIRGNGDPIPMNFRLENTDSSWKIYDVNISGVWLVDNYRNTFAAEINASGIDGLIAKLKDKNKSNAAR